jgi:hypothetical protein
MDRTSYAVAFLLALPGSVAAGGAAVVEPGGPAAGPLLASGWSAALVSGDGLDLTLDPSGRVIGLEVAGSDVLDPALVAWSGFSANDLSSGGHHPADGPVESGADAAYQNTTTATGLLIESVVRALPDRMAFEARVSDTLLRDHSLELRYSLPLAAGGWKWWRDLRTNESILPATNYSDTEVMDNQGRRSNSHPFSALTSPWPGPGLSLAQPIDAPAFAVTEVSSGGLNITFPLAVSGVPGARSAVVQFYLHRLAEPAWGFRAAVEEYYATNPGLFDRNGSAEGVWVVNSPLDAIPSPEDFGFGVHEIQFPEDIANASLVGDALGVETYAYIHPRSFFMGMGNRTSRPTEQQILAELANLTNSPDPAEREYGRAVHASGCLNRTGGFVHNVFQRPVWFPPNGWGVEFCYFSGPTLPQANLTWNTRANLAWKHEIDPQFAAAEAVNATLDGVFIDGFYSWSMVYVTEDGGDDFASEHLPHALGYPLVPNPATLRPVVSAHFGALDLGKNVSDALHARGAKFMQNDLRPGAWFPVGLVDLAGIEVDWFPSGAWTPDPVEVMGFRRTMMGQRPFGLLQRSDFALVDAAEVEAYFERSLFWAIYPSFFANRGDDLDNYWSNSSLYERDRPAYRRFVPLVRELSTAGWEPVTRANSSDPGLLVERYGPSNGTLYVALRNEGPGAATTRVTIDLAALGMPLSGLEVVEVVSGSLLPHTIVAGVLEADLTLNGASTAVLRVKRSTAIPGPSHIAALRAAVLVASLLAAGARFTGPVRRSRASQVPRHACGGTSRPRAPTPPRALRRAPGADPPPAHRPPPGSRPPPARTPPTARRRTRGTRT